jgi:hypothetical protein
MPSDHDDQRTPRQPLLFEPHLTAPYGFECQLTLDPSEAEIFNRDPDAYAASVYRLTKDDYRAWVDANGLPMCGCRTRKGTMCPNVVGKYHPHLSPDEWMARNRRHACAAHRGQPIEAAGG